MENKLRTKFLPQERYTYYSAGDKKVRHGLYVQWFDDLRIKYKVKCLYKDGLLDGMFESFNENGSLNQRRFYFKGIEVSEETSLNFTKEEEVQRLTEAFVW